jgi:outer membrane beta-barrel protein
MKLVYFVCFSVLIVPLFGWAQSHDNEFELSGFLGGVLNDHSSVRNLSISGLDLPGNPTSVTTMQSFDSGMLFTIKAGYFLTENLQLEGAIGMGPSQKVKLFSELDCSEAENCAGPFSNELNANTYYFDGNLVYNFHYGKFSPFISAGMGAVNSKVHIEDVSDFTFNVGVGAKYYFGRFGLRLELNDHIIPNYRFDNSTQHDLQFNSGIMLRF